MSAKRYKPAMSASGQRIRKASQHLKKMSMQRKIELMVAAGALTESQAEQARKNLVETTAAADLNAGG